MARLKQVYFNTLGLLHRESMLPGSLHTTGVRIIYPFYHIVSDTTPAHIKHLYPCVSKKQFEKDLDFILKYYTPLHPDDLAHKKYDPAKNYFVLSFDDGFREMHTYVAQVLMEKGIPAAFFINPGFVDNAALMHRCIVSCLLENKKQQKKVLQYIREKKGRFIIDLKKYLMHLHFSDTPWLHELAEVGGWSVREYLHQIEPYMSKEQIGDLRKQGFVIGAHSMTHPEYQYISTDEQMGQTENSIQYVQQHFPQEQTYFAFPFTDHKVSTEVLEYLRAETTLFFGTGGLRKNATKHIQRIPMELYGYDAMDIILHEYGYYKWKKRLGRV